MSTDATSSYASDLFKHDLYKIKASNDPLPNGAYPVGTTYKIKFKTDTALEIPLALLYATFQIALSDVASYQAESYMNKIVTNQEIQIASSRAIAEAEQMQEDIIDTGAGYVAVHDGYTLVSDITSDTGMKEYMIANDIYAFDPSDYTTDMKMDTYSVVFNDGSTATLRKTTTPGATTEDDPIITYAIENKQPPSQSLSDDFIQECYTAGITEINGKQLCAVDATGEVILTYETDEKGKDIPGTGKPTPLDVALTDDDLEDLTTELELAQEEASSSTQEDMVFAEEYLGQYTSYLSGGSSNIDDLNNALQGIAQRI